MIYGYIRVSTDKQTVENQRFEINRFIKKTGLHVDSWIEETISGTVSPKKRNLGKLIEKNEEGRFDYLFGAFKTWAKYVYDYVDFEYFDGTRGDYIYSKGKI